MPEAAAPEGGVDADVRDVPADVVSDGDVAESTVPRVIQMLRLGDADGAPGTLDPAGDRDLYRLEAQAGTWVAIRTLGNPNDVADGLDTVVILYDAQMQRLTFNDDAQPRVNSDSELVLKLPGQGASVYFVEVLEYSDFVGRAPRGGPSFVYRLSAVALTHLSTGVVSDVTQMPELEGEQGLILGDIGDDPDDYSFSVSEPGGRQLDITLLNPLETNPVGGLGTLSVLLGSEVVARISATGDALRLSPHLSPGEYRLRVQGPSTNSSYALKYFVLGDSAGEVDDAQNDVFGTPQILTVSPPGAVFFRLQVREGDVDHVAIDAPLGQLSLVCDSGSRGSGIVGLAATLLDSQQTTLASQTESPGTRLELTYQVPSPQRLTLRFQKSAQSSEVTGQWVRCALRLS